MSYLSKDDGHAMTKNNTPWSTPRVYTMKSELKKKKLKFKEWFVNDILLESKQNIINLGYPPIIAKLLYERFGKNSFLMAKWFREYKLPIAYPDFPKNWWLQATSNFNEVSLYDLTYLYSHADNIDDYLKAVKHIGLSRNEDDILDLDEQKEALKEQIKDKLFSDIFFNYHSIVKDIGNGKIKDISQYKNMRFQEAQHEYDRKNIFDKTIPFKKYKNDYKWINVGRSCRLVGHLMKNCGSVGLMSMDKDATMFVLFDPNNNAHAIVTYSPNQRKISGDQGVASTEVKSKYHKYVLDLAKILNATFDAEGSKSTLLKLRYQLKQAKNIKNMSRTPSVYDKYFSFVSDGKKYYTNGDEVISKESIQKLQNAIQNGQINLKNRTQSLVRDAFNYQNKPIISTYGIQYIPVKQFGSN